MLFHSSIRRDVSKTFGGTLVVLLTIVMTMMLIRTLGQASKGSVNPQEIILIMGYSVLGHVPTILTLSLFIAIVSSLSRMYKDSEMVIWQGAGQSIFSFAKPLLSFALPILAAILAMALWVWPWTNQQTQEMKERFEQRGDIERIAPGQFQESANGKRVFFIDQTNSGKQGVFIATTENNKQTVTSAERGHIESLDNYRHLVLGFGQRLERVVGESAFKLSEFTRMGSVIEEEQSLANALPVKAQSSMALWQAAQSEHLGELAWRIGLGLAAFNFIWMGLAVSHVNPRVGRGGNLMFALLAFIVYYNMINVSQAWIAGGLWKPLQALVLLHGGVFVGSLLWLTAKQQQWALLPTRAWLLLRTRKSGHLLRPN